MFYVKRLDENGEVVSLITYDRKPVIRNGLTVEITEEEYNTLQAELEAKWEEENPVEEETGEETEEAATEADYIAALQELGVEI